MARDATPNGRRAVQTPAPERSRLVLDRGVLVFRWVALAWMATVAASGPEGFRSPTLAWASIVAAGMWTLWLTVAGPRWTGWTLYADLILCLWLLLASGIVVPEDAMTSNRPFFATGYPLSAALSWGVARGPLGGLTAATVLSVGLVLSRAVNGVPMSDLDGRELQNLAGSIVNYLVAGAAVGLVSRLLVESAEAVQLATDELVHERERTARLAERESLARTIHDSVLQSLALVHKRGRELASRGHVPTSEVGRLAEIAGAQERELRAVIARTPEEPPTGQASLRTTLEAVCRSLPALDVGVSSVGPIWLERRRVDELAAAVRQALENVAQHAEASKTSVFADRENSWITITVRDDGVGFVYDESELKGAGKVGVLKSIKGRIEDLGGTTTVTTAPGAGTEIELRVPASDPLDM